MKPFLLIAAAVAAAVPVSAAERADTLACRRAPEIAVAAGGSLVVNAALTEALKYSVHELRPDRTEHNSFPSRHTSWAFTASTVLANELYRYSPWWALGAHAVAGAVGFDRIVERRHYASDVVAGAALGIASTELVYFITRKIYRTPSAWSVMRPENDFRFSLAVQTGAVYNFGHDFCTGYTTAVRARLPLSDCWGIGLSAVGSSTPVKTQADGVRPLNTFGLTAGVAAHFALPVRSLALEPGVEAGASRLLPVSGRAMSSWGFTANAGCGLSWRITPSFACRGEVGYSIITTPAAVSGVTVSISSVAVF